MERNNRSFGAFEIHLKLGQFHHDFVWDDFALCFHHRSMRKMRHQLMHFHMMSRLIPILNTIIRLHLVRPTFQQGSRPIFSQIKWQKFTWDNMNNHCCPSNKKTLSINISANGACLTWNTSISSRTTSHLLNFITIKFFQNSCCKIWNTFTGLNTLITYRIDHLITRKICVV